MFVQDLVVAHALAFCLSASLIMLLLKFAVAEKLLASSPPSRFSPQDHYEYPDSRIKISAYVFVLCLGLLVARTSGRAKRQKLVPGIPIVGGNVDKVNFVAIFIEVWRCSHP